VYNRVLFEWEQLFGSENKWTLAVMYDLGHLYLLQGRYGDTEQLLERVLQINDKQLGSEYNTFMTMRELGYVYAAQERYEDAEKMLTKAVEAQEKTLGLEHIETTFTNHTLASVYHSQQRYNDAEALFKQVL
jgi:tetratricopeptide (TPR) repeat protein